jgi:broad specificity phosphatase PhoE
MRTFSALLLSAALSACVRGAVPAPAIPGADPGTTTVIVVRHAEKAAEPAADPPLTAAGVARAQALVDALRGVPIRAVISTDFARTRSTVAPIATRLGLTTQLVDARARDHVRHVASDVLARYRGETVLVAGHSNTVPDIVAALGAPRPAGICDSEYDNLYVVRVPAAGPATVERRKYGAPSVLGEGCGAGMK